MEHDKIIEIIATRLRDIYLLEIMCKEPTTPEEKMTWQYHINLNKAIIREMSRGNYEISHAYLIEIKRSTTALKKYIQGC